MNLKQLEAFVNVAELGSYSKAARHMFLTQPTVSAHIFSLEKELSVRLFIRNTKEVFLTDDGKKLYKYAKEMMDLEKKIEESFREDAEDTSTGITIAASTIPSQYLLPEIIGRFREKYPKEKINVIETDSQDVVGKIVDHVVDVGFTGTTLEKKHCKYVPFYKDELVIVTPNNAYYQNIKDNMNNDISWVKDEPAIMRNDGSGTRKEAEKLLSKHGITEDDLHVVATIDNQETIKKSVCQGIGISIMSKLATKEDERLGKLLVFDLSFMKSSRNINLVYNKNYPLSRSVNRFIRVVEEME